VGLFRRRHGLCPNALEFDWGSQDRIAQYNGVRNLGQAPLTPKLTPASSQSKPGDGHPRAYFRETLNEEISLLNSVIA
jgi:hypothetical protein